MNTATGVRDLSFHAVLCDLDGVICFYDTAEVTQLEEATGLPEGITAAIGFAPENDLPPLLGQITRDQWAQSIVQKPGSCVPLSDAHALTKAFTEARFWADEAVVSLLRQIREHCPVVLVTNATV